MYCLSDHSVTPPILHYVSSSTGRVPVSKTGGCSFESSLTCQTVALLCTVFGGSNRLPDNRGSRGMDFWTRRSHGFHDFLPCWRNWYTRSTQNRLPYGMRVRFPCGALPLPSFDQGRFSFFSPSAIRFTISTRTGRMRPERIFRPSPSWPNW